MNESSHRMNLNQRSKQELEATHETGPESAVLEFRSAEEMLRHDAATIEVPAGIGERLADSAADTPTDPWWRRLFKS